MSDPWKSFGPDRGLAPYASRIEVFDRLRAVLNTENQT